MSKKANQPILLLSINVKFIFIFSYFKFIYKNVKINTKNINILTSLYIIFIKLILSSNFMANKQVYSYLLGLFRDTTFPDNFKFFF